MSIPYCASPTEQTQSQLSYITTQAVAIEQRLERLQNLRHELRGIVIQCDPMAFPPTMQTCEPNFDGNALTPVGHIATIITTQNKIQSTIDEELNGLESVINTLRLLVG
jgi:hypothetical protein